MGLIDEEGGLGVTYRLRQCWCGRRNRLLIIFILLALLVVVGIAVAVAVILTMSKYHVKKFRSDKIAYLDMQLAHPLHVKIVNCKLMITVVSALSYPQYCLTADQLVYRTCHSNN